MVVCVDADPDGTQIQGLILSFIQKFWPTLIDLGMVFILKTPIVKAADSTGEHYFYSIAAFEVWRAAADRAPFEAKHCSSLSSTSVEEFQKYIRDLDRHCVVVVGGGREGENALDVAFCTNSSARRELLDESMEIIEMPVLYDATTTSITVEKLVRIGMVEVWHSVRIRIFPSTTDGMLPCERLIVEECRKQNGEALVSTIAALVAATDSYHHRATNLYDVINRMAASDKNNIRILEARSQLGSAQWGGVDSVSSHYGYVRMAVIAPLLMAERDRKHIQWRQTVTGAMEPKGLMPLLPICLINGVQSIGGSIRSKVPSCNPLDLIWNVDALLSERPTIPLQPHINNFFGTIIYQGGGEYVCKGTLVYESGAIRITAIPPGTCLEDYKTNVLNPLKEVHGFSYEQQQSEIGTAFKLFFAEDRQETPADRRFLEYVLGLKSNFDTNSMYLFDRHNKLRKFDTLDDILFEFYEERLEALEKHWSEEERTIKVAADALRASIAKCQGNDHGPCLVALLNEKEAELAAHRKDTPKEVWRHQLYTLAEALRADHDNSNDPYASLMVDEEFVDDNESLNQHQLNPPTPAEVVVTAAPGLLELLTAANIVEGNGDRNASLMVDDEFVDDNESLNQHQLHPPTPAEVVVTDSVDRNASLRHRCIKCNKDFRFKTDLNRHLVVHTGARPYGCTACNSH